MENKDMRSVIGLIVAAVTALFILGFIFKNEKSQPESTWKPDYRDPKLDAKALMNISPENNSIFATNILK